MTDTLIIGGGVAGCAAAITLVQAGRAVLLLERDVTAQHKVCGEFLSEEALLYLRKLGIDRSALESVLGAVPIRAVRLTAAGHTREAALPFPAMSLTRRALDEAMLSRAQSLGVQVQRGVHVESLTQASEGWCVRTAETHTAASASLVAHTAMLATGKHDLRGHARPQGVQNGLVAFKMYWRLTQSQSAALAEHVELTLYRGGYAGLQCVEAGAANLCCVIESSEYKRLGGRWASLLEAMCAASPLLAARLRGAEALLTRPLALSSIPYGLVRQRTDSLWCLGDQAAVIPSFTGDGMSLALHSGVLAATMHTEGASASAFQQRMAAQVQRQVRNATLLSKGLVQWPSAALYAARFWPGILQTVARQTRIAEKNMLA